jgi:hypothetical protein
VNAVNNHVNDRFANLAKMAMNEDPSFFAAFERKQSAFERSASNYDLVKTMLGEAKFFNIDGRRFEFSEVDPIFKRESSCPPKHNTQTNDRKCSCCDAEFKSAKSKFNW